MLALIKSLIRKITGAGRIVSYGQFGEDALIQRTLKKKKGTYVDVGCYHPVLYSNTYGFYRRGWRGIVVDPNRSLKNLYRILRHGDTLINVGVGDSPSSGQYYYHKDGAYNGFSKSNKTPVVRIEQTEIRTLNQIVSGLKEIDFLNIDAEGMDDVILKGFNFSPKPEVIAIESSVSLENIAENPTHALLKSKGYVLVGAAGLTFVYKNQRA